jgi:hypothetical protein
VDPRKEASGKLFAVKRSAYRMALVREVLPDWTEAQQERLHAFWVLNAAHATLSFSRGFVAVLTTVADT